ncbi:MAG: RNA polymerase sigma-70 factor (ECF subfamily) [Planctomycetota bacterium]|jgi:RNA polymerase sigma-70 factor (ECF subfamily)
MQWRDVEDDALLEQAANEEPGAVEELIQRFDDRLCSYLMRLVRDRAWAEDLVQEVFLRALQEAHRYDTAWPVGVWLFRIARNLALDLLRSEAGHRARTQAQPAPITAPAAITTAEHREFQIALEAALQRLPEEFRSVFLLREGESLSYDEIGAVLNISTKTVSSRLHRARQQLRTTLQRHTEL